MRRRHGELSGRAKKYHERDEKIRRLYVEKTKYVTGKHSMKRHTNRDFNFIRRQMKFKISNERLRHIVNQ